MKREIIVLMALLCCLTGCSRSPRYDNPYRVDTVIQIPVNPTDAPTEPAATETPAKPEKAAEETESTQEEPTAASEKDSASGSTAKKPSSGKSSSKASGTSSSKSSSKKTSSNKTSTGNNTSDQSAPTKNETKETEPPAEKPTDTQPPETTPAESAPDKTEPSDTTPAEISPQETQPPTEPPSYDPSGYRVGNLEYEVLDQINKYREEAGVEPLSMDKNLCAVASVRAFEISILWSHTRPDGRSYKSVLSDYGYSSGSAAENLIHTSGSGDASAMVAKWMSSEKNQKILLSESFTAAGIGVYSAGGVTYLANLLIG